MSRQHANPVLFTLRASAGVPLRSIEVTLEADIQEFVHAHPEALPIAEIDPAFVNPIAICRELGTPAGPIDNFMVTATGMPVLVECKLWRNPQARREVVGQVLDYAKELSRWTSADIAREAAKRGVPSLFDRIRSIAPDADEAAFHDALSGNLARGRCLLLIVGDGIRDGVEAIFEHLRSQALLHFSFGLVEIPMFELPDGGRLVVPRVLARTAIDVRRVIELPAGLKMDDGENTEASGPDPETVAFGDERQRFWEDFLARLKLDDPEQPIPRAPRQGHITFTMPAAGSSAWLTVYRIVAKGEVGMFLSYYKNSPAETAVRAVVENWSDGLSQRLGGTAFVHMGKDEKLTILEKKQFGDLSQATARSAALDWLTTRTNDFINVFRPAIRAAAAEPE
ncbi:hypothetical protein OEW28_17325 [Defluviimonas sp. WL0002]|uniref:DUF4268 domain-containing protein n=1 Tax=Albidovulum marisflavi TaxID=2984159 RepID=A0ABT2ZH57_9RHOB|nr:hypothetical protein [Defluviimonas sp. WL0002]MCV2870378.1 hypothetical protein [Defluviimonas sp. WL0002]